MDDKDRLDWIEKNYFDKKWNGVVDGGSRTDWMLRRPHIQLHCASTGSFRNAIDQAIASEPKEEHLNGFSGMPGF